MSTELNLIETSHLRSIAATTQEVVEVGMEVIREYQRGELSAYTRSEVLASPTQKAPEEASEEAMRQYLNREYKGLSVYGEKLGQDDDDEDFTYTLLLAPLDGVRALSASASSSVVAASLVAGPEGKLIASTIGEPSTGRLWYSFAGKTIRKVIENDRQTRTVTSTETKVWDGSIHEDGTVFIDNLKAFKKHGRAVLTSANLVKLFSGIQSTAAIHNYGSNSLHTALVANGGDRVAGAITTSVGGPWDLGGALHVRNAGGLVESYTLGEDRKLRATSDPLVPFTPNLMLTANNTDTMEFLRDRLEEALEVDEA